MESSYKRKWWNAFRIEWGLQKRLLFMLMGITGLGVLFSAVLFWYFYQNLMDQIVGGDLPFLYSPEQMAAIAQQIPTIRTSLLQWIVLLTLLNITLIVLAVVLVIHRLSGPLYNIKRALTHVANGNLTVSIDLRKSDDLQDLASGLNEMIVRFQIVILGLRDHLNDMEEAEKNRDTDAVKKARAGIKDALSYFEIVDIPQSEDAIGDR